MTVRHRAWTITRPCGCPYATTWDTRPLTNHDAWQQLFEDDHHAEQLARRQGHQLRPARPDDVKRLTRTCVHEAAA